MNTSRGIEHEDTEPLWKAWRARMSEIGQLLAPERQVDVRLMNGVTWSATLIERDGLGVLVRMVESRRRVFVPWTNVAAIRDALPDDDRDDARE